MNHSSLLNPVALITGAGKRIGKAIAEQCASRGYDVAVHYAHSQTEALETVAALQKSGVRASAIQADLAQPARLKQLVEQTYQQFGQLNILINCAAVFFQDHIHDFTLENLTRAWEVNCRAPLLLTQAFYNEAKARQQTGVVINIIDEKICNNFNPDNFSYTASKTALGYLTKMLAVSCMPVLRINAIYPGLTLPSGDQTLEDFDYTSQRATPLGCTVSVQEMASAVLLLTQPSFNGTDFIVDAGQNLLRVERDVGALYRAPCI